MVIIFNDTDIQPSTGSSTRLLAVLRILMRLTGTHGDLATGPIMASINAWLVVLEQDISLHTPPATYGSSFPALTAWGECVELAWQIAIGNSNARSSQDEQSWGALTSRLLLWNTFQRGGRSGDWARRQTVASLRYQA